MRHISVNGTAYVLFEPDQEELVRLATEAGFQADMERQERVLLVTLVPLFSRPMFFDAADPRQAARLAAGRTFVNGVTGGIFNTPMAIEFLPGSVRVRLATEVRWDQARKYPQGACESSVVVLFQQVLQDLSAGMVGVCGAPPRNRALAPAAR